MRTWRFTLAAGVLATVLAAPAPVRAAIWEDAGWGILTVLANTGYMPAKLVYSTLGAITGGFAYGLTGGDSEVAGNIWGPSLGGDYVVTPPMLRGEEPIVFAAFDEPGASETDPEPPPLREDRLSGL